jgi:glycosyltransferase involved in cell wall biosynthesis
MVLDRTGTFSSPMNPIVTIILPTYKDAPYLARAIESVIAQTLRDWELVIIDDGLAPQAKQQLTTIAATDSRIRIIANDRNIGIQRSLNRGIADAQGMYLARIDDDDVWIDTHKLEKQVSFFTAHPRLVLLGTDAIIVDHTNAVLGVYSMPIHDTAIRDRMALKNCFLHPTVMMRTETVRAVGGYPEEEHTRHIEDYALWLRLGTVGDIANLPDQTTSLTVHADSITAQHRLHQALHMRSIIKLYKHAYPHYWTGCIVLTLRQVVFWIANAVPIPQRLLYFIQKLYKSF